MSVSYDRVDDWEVRGCDGGFGVFDHDTMLSGPHLSRTEAIRAALEQPRPLPRRLEGLRCSAERPDALKTDGFCAQADAADRAPSLIASTNERLLHAEADRRLGAATR